MCMVGYESRIDHVIRNAQSAYQFLWPVSSPYPVYVSSVVCKWLPLTISMCLSREVALSV